MAINFPQSTQVIRSDRLMPTALLATIAALLMISWGVWAWFSRIPLVAPCSEARVTADGMVSARCPVAVDAGAAVEILRPGTPGPPIKAVVNRIADRFTTDLAAGLIEVTPDDGARLAPDTVVTVRIITGTISPLAYLMHGGVVPQPTAVPAPAP
jgi:hypothetical protein